MKTDSILQPIKTKDGSPSLLHTELNEHYHSIYGALSESLHVFINNGLMEMIPTKKQINLLEVGLGTGLNAFLTIQKALKNTDVSVFYQSLEPYPIPFNIAETLAENIKGTVQEKQYFLDIHFLSFEKEHPLHTQFIFQKSKTGIEKFATNRRFDLVYFDAFSPNKVPHLWTEEVFKHLFHLMQPSGILVTYCAKGSIKRLLKNIGFELETLKGALGKREMIRVRKP